MDIQHRQPCFCTMTISVKEIRCFTLQHKFLVLLKNESKQFADLLLWIALFYGYQLFLPNSSNISFHNSTLVSFGDFSFLYFKSLWFGQGSPHSSAQGQANDFCLTNQSPTLQVSHRLNPGLLLELLLILSLLACGLSTSIQMYLKLF